MVTDAWPQMSVMEWWIPVHCLFHTFTLGLTHTLDRLQRNWGYANWTEIDQNLKTHWISSNKFKMLRHFDRKRTRGYGNWNVSKSKISYFKTVVILTDWGYANWNVYQNVKFTLKISNFKSKYKMISHFDRQKTWGYTNWNVPKLKKITFKLKIFKNEF